MGADSLAPARPVTGSFAWLEATNGALTARERLSMLPPLMRTFGRFSTDRVRLALGLTPRHSLTAAELWPVAPDSALGRHAEEEAHELQSIPMRNHGYRTWVFGSALAAIDGAPLDDESFYASSLVHDVGLEHPSPGRCFTHRSARAVASAAERAGVDPRLKHEMMDGISMHISPGLRYEESAIGYYLQAGAIADLAGVRAWELPSDLRSRADQAYPRGRIHEVLSTCWHAEAKHVARGRAQLADTYGQFSRVVRWLPRKGA